MDSRSPQPDTSLPSFSSWYACFILAPALLLGACTGGHEQLDAELDRLKDELIRVQSENDSLDERVMALEQSRINAAGEPQAARETESERPPLKVVKLVPVANGRASEPEGAGSVQPPGTHPNP